VEELAAGGSLLHRAIRGLSPELGQEIAHRAQQGSLWDAYRSVVETYGTPGPIYEYPKGVLSAVALTHRGEPLRVHSRGLERCGRWLEETAGSAVAREGMGAAAREGRRQRARLERKIERIRADLQKLPDEGALRLQADALVAGLGQVKRGDGEAVVPDPTNPSHTLRFAIDPSQTPGENVDALYRRVRKTARAREMLALRLAQAERELREGPPVPAAAGTGAEREQTSGPYRKFLSSDGWPIWVGRNRVENDRLLREARPWDLWLHARDASGAHVLVRKPGKEAQVPERTLLEAAGLAARFSGLAGEAAVDVMALDAGRVRRPKGAGPGRVLVAGERTVRVPPGAGRPQPR
jgi:predicted ribosome quality control (RQC) complex YloA/Tae2 family protein